MTKEKTELLLVDGSALLHRAYHAYPKLTSRDGKLVNAVYGFASMLIAALDSIHPEYVAVAWDVGKPTFRHEQYVAYKAQRPKTDEELIEQIPAVHEMLSAFGIPQLEQEGYEADDIIGSLAHQMIKKHQARLLDTVIILTGDQDTMQLVSENVGVLVPSKGAQAQKLYTPQDVSEKYGVTPEQIVDYKALVGDSSDNIPGVAGVGPVSAARLLNAFGSLDAIYKAVDQELRMTNTELRKIDDSLLKKLREGKESAYLSRDLSQIKRDMRLGVALKKLAYETVATDEAREFLERAGFKSLVRRVFGSLEQKDNRQVGMF